MTILTLGLRFARTGAWLRAVTLVIASAITGWLFTLSFALPAAVLGSYYTGSGALVLQLIYLIASFMPSAVLLSTAVRASGMTRDSRLASLRILGFTPRATRAIATVESGVPAVLGAALGVVAAYLTAPHFPRQVTPGTVLLQIPLTIAPTDAAVGFFGSLLVALVIVFASTWRIGEHPLQSRKAGTIKQLSPWRAAVYLLGIVVLTIPFLIKRPSVATDIEAYHRWQQHIALAFVAGGAIILVGIILAVPWTVREYTRRFGSRSRYLPLALASRRVEVEPLGSARVVTGLSLSVFLAVSLVGGVGVLSARDSYMTDFPRAQHGPYLAYLGTGDRPSAIQHFSPELVRKLADIPHVAAVIPRFPLNVELSPAVTSNWVDGIWTSCEQLKANLGLHNCDPTKPALIGSVDYLKSVSGAHSAAIGKSPQDATNSNVVPGSPSFELSEPIVIPASSSFLPLAKDSLNGLFVPDTIFHYGDLETDGIWIIVKDGVAGFKDVAAAAFTLGLTLKLNDLFTYSETESVKGTVLPVVALFTLLSLAAIFAGAVDRALERRREVACLAVVGIRPSTLRWTQFIQVLLPAVLGTLLATIAATLAVWCGSLVAFRAEFTHFPVPLVAMFITMLISLGVTMAVAGLTVLGTGARVTPSLLRRE